MAKPDWEDQFVEYFGARASHLRRLGYALSGDWHTAEDLVQLTFVRLYRHWKRIAATSVDAYARRILVNAYLSHRRARQRERILAEVPDRSIVAADPTGRLTLRQALTTLPPRQRAVLVLRYLEDLPVTDVAALLDITEGTVKSQAARGLRNLRGALADLVSVKE